VSSVDAQLYGTSIGINDLQDQRTFLSDSYNPSYSDGGLSGSWSGFFISWNISETSPNSGLWNYSYSLGNGMDVSNFILELTDDTTQVFNISSNDPALSWEIDTFSSSGVTALPNPIYGIKFENNDFNPLTISFQSYADPVWGNFHAVDGLGGTVVAYNNALAISGFNSNDPLDFIARPDGGNNPPVVPEPVSSTLLIIGATVLRMRRYFKSEK